ncbi:MAG: ABC transporter permease [Deltaproteobacteria bacterium]|nr:ABC transporter permease [Deltaproteobacteria bacterium]
MKTAIPTKATVCPEGAGADPLDPSVNRAEFERKTRVRRYKVFTLRAAFGIGGLLFWEWASRALIDPFWISRPSEIAARLREWYFTGFFFPHLWVTLQEMATGFAIGLFFAVLAGFLLGTRKMIADIVDPFLMAVWSVPGIVLGPLFILYFGIGFTPKMVLVAVTVFFLVFFNTFTGIRSVDQEWINTLRIMGATEREVFTKAILPASAVWIFSSFKNAIPYTLVAAVVGELIASQKGIGYLIEDASGVMDTTGVFAALFNLMLIGLVLNEIVERAERRVLRWKGDEH